MMSVLALTRMFFFFFNDTATTEIYTLSLHDALPISDVYRLIAKRLLKSKVVPVLGAGVNLCERPPDAVFKQGRYLDRKSTRLNSSHANISYAVFCLKKKKKKTYLCIIAII